MATELTLAEVIGPVETPAGLKPTSGRVQWRLPAPGSQASTVVGPVVQEALLDAEGQFSKMLWCPTAGAGGLSYAVSLTWWDDVTASLQTVSLGYMSLAYSASPQALKGLLVPEMPAVVPTDILAAAAAYASSAAGSATAADADRVAAEQAAALALTGSPYRFNNYADMVARTRYSGAVSPQINVTAGNRLYTDDYAYDVLASGAAGAGEIVLPSPSNVRVKVLNTSDAQAFGADGVGDDLPQIKRAATTGRVHLSAIASGSYELTDDYTDPLSGVFLSADWKNASIKVTGVYGTMLGGVVWTTPVTLLANNKITYPVAPSPSLEYKDAVASLQTARERFHRPVNLATEVTPLQIAWPSADTFTAGAGAASGRRYNYTTTGASNHFRGPFVQVGPYETVSGIIESPPAGPIGVMVRGRGGYIVVYGDTDAGDYIMVRKETGLAGVTTNLTWVNLGQGRTTDNSPRKAVWSVSRFSGDRANVLINKHALIEIGGIGDLLDVGFVVFGNTAAFNVAGLTLLKRTDIKFGQPELDQAYVFGDSNSDRTPGAWPYYLRQKMDGFAGVALNDVPNYAVAGTYVQDALNAMTAVGTLAGAQFVLVGSGANDIQAQTNITAFETSVAGIVSYVSGQQRVPVWILPYNYYAQAQSLLETGQTGKGLNPTNYDMGNRYRAAIERIVVESGGIAVDPNSELPYAHPRYLARRPKDPFLRDNIHFGQGGYHLLADRVAQAIADRYCALPESVELLLPEVLYQNGATGPELRFIVDKAGVWHMSGKFLLSATTTAVMLQMPRWMRPLRNFDAPAIPFGPSATLAPARIFIETNGNVTRADVPSGATQLFVTASWKGAF